MFVSRLVAAAACLVCLSQVAVGAADDPVSFECVFPVGTARSYEKGKFKPERASKVVFGIDRVAVEKQTAVIKRTGAEGNLRVVRAVDALHFLEVVGEGYMNITTVYDRDPRSGKHPAVHSRHFGVLGQPVFAQYHGFCSSR